MRKVWSEIYRQKKAKYECPKCKQLKVVRVASGIWNCKHCGYKFAGGSYTPEYSQRIIEEMVESGL